MKKNNIVIFFIFTIFIMMFPLTSLWGKTGNEKPIAFTHKVKPIGNLEQIIPEPIDLETVTKEDKEREREGLPHRFAILRSVKINPKLKDKWEKVNSEVLLWRLRISSKGARHLNLGFTRYHLPKGGRLFIYSADYNQVLGPFTEYDNKEHAQLWTPIINSNDIILELSLPANELPQLELELGAINQGYRGFKNEKALGDSGACNVNVACPEGDLWRDQIRSVAVYTLNGYWDCTGSLINNTSQDYTPFFLTANHCLVNSESAPTMVVYWNFQAATCDGVTAPLDQFQTGAIFRASYTLSDFTLVELDDMPSPAFNVYYAGWDRSSTAPSSGVAVHHPRSDMKKISIENQSLTVTSWGGDSSPGDGTHLRVADWDIGTTEPGSSGCPFFNQDKRVVGNLHGGSSACGNNESDWFGRFYTSWTGGGTNSTRLSNWLDPLGTAQTTLDGKNPYSRDCGVCEPVHSILGIRGTIGTVPWRYRASGNCGNGGKWVGRFVGEAGATYHFDLCPDSPGDGINSGFDSNDPDIKITNSSCTIIPGAGEDGSCGSPTFSPNDFQWKCLANGTYYVIIAPYPSYESHTCTGTASNTFTLKYYKEVHDGILNFSDFTIFAFYWMNDTCSDPNWCEGSDSDCSGRVDFVDLLNFVDHWLEGI